METLLYVARLVATGQLDVEGCVKITTSSQEVEAIGPDGRYKDYVSVDSERLGPDKYSFELTYEEYEISEVTDYIKSGQYDLDLNEFKVAQQNAIARVAELIAEVTGPMSELLTLANKFSIPANIKVGKYTNDFRLIDAVDWDSSSMYC
ncbi:hypothetical protein QGX11_gp079 [Pseudomonas phage PPSC2]|uniref:Uncharacterized protein n=1 Tax=Pseudomonas phage PPSC2 TaxID=2041350 RepID=A0A2R2YB09_9CAUD|nr:hypothetical protein QGX11_gp079 [Pseudomonas phage PPSC2]ATN92842.1 hypothetical protein PPSC2_79 [Pseudomonas phage PPSC2]